MNATEARARHYWESFRDYKRVVDRKLLDRVAEVVTTRRVDFQQRKDSDMTGWYVVEDQSHIYEGGGRGLTGGAVVAGPFTTCDQAVAQRIEMDENNPICLGWERGDEIPDHAYL